MTLAGCFSTDQIDYEIKITDFNVTAVVAVENCTLRLLLLKAANELLFFLGDVHAQL